MIGHYLALMKREFWEHRSMWLTPLVTAAVVTLFTIMALAFAGNFAQELNIAIFGAQNIADEVERRAILTGLFVGLSPAFFIGLAILVIFYALDSLYAERKDKSILFWRSLPVTDAETVVSKLLTALLLVPAFTVAGIIATHLANLVITSIWVSMKVGDAGMLIWGSVSLFDNWMFVLVVIYCFGIWMSPFLGWFLFVSAYTRRAPLLMAFLPPTLISIIEGIFFRSTHFAEAVWGRGPKIPLFRDFDIERVFGDDGPVRLSSDSIGLLSHLDVGRFATSVDTWLGIVVCGLLTTAAIYVRRYRDES